jgi:uroporphyrinogen decarboxylase
MSKTPVSHTAPLLLRACRGEPVERSPVWAMRQAGRWDPEFLRLRAGVEFYEFSQDPQRAAEASLLPERFGVDAIILFYDITTLAVAMGLRFDLHPARGPVPHRPIQRLEQVESLAAEPDPGRYGHILDLLAIVRRELAGRLPVIVFASAPFTLASYCIGTGKDVARTREFVHEQPLVWDALCDRIHRATISFLRHLGDAGADCYQLFDSWAGSLTEAEYRGWATHYHQQVFRDGPAIPSILFVRECPYLDLMVESGANVVSLGTRHDLAAARAAYPARPFQGNVDHDLLVTGTADEVRAATLECLRRGGGRCHVLNLNHGVDRSTPVENFRAYVDAARSYTPD